MTRRAYRLAATVAAFALSLPLLGCNPAAPENHTPPPPSAMIDRIKNNPHMSPEQKQAALEAYESHQAMGTSRGKVLPGGKK